MRTSCWPSASSDQRLPSAPVTMLPRVHALDATCSVTFPVAVMLSIAHPPLPTAPKYISPPGPGVIQVGDAGVGYSVTAPVASVTLATLLTYCSVSHACPGEPPSQATLTGPFELASGYCRSVGEP